MHTCHGCLHCIPEDSGTGGVARSRPSETFSGTSLQLRLWSVGQGHHMALISLGAGRIWQRGVEPLSSFPGKERIDQDGGTSALGLDFIVVNGRSEANDDCGGVGRLQGPCLGPFRICL
jgi:hypothetical protein